MIPTRWPWLSTIGLLGAVSGFSIGLWVPRSPAISVGVAGLHVVLPASWRIRRQEGNPLVVTAGAPGSSARLTIVYTPPRDNPGPVKWLPVNPAPTLPVNPAHPYILDQETATPHVVIVKGSEIAADGGSHTVTVSGTSPKAVARLLGRVRWPAPLTATEAVHHLEAAHDTAPPVWLHHRWGWVLAYGEGALGFQSVDLFRTTNGGKTWQFAAPTTYGEPFPTANSMAGGPLLAFATPQRGWLAQVNDVRSGLALYRTQDGGRSWTFVRFVSVPHPSLTGWPTKTGAVITQVRFVLPDVLFTWKTMTTTHHSTLRVGGA